jgi:hypothetical protein
MSINLGRFAAGAAATCVLLVMFGGVAAAEPYREPAPDSNLQTTRMFKANCKAAGGHFSEGTDKNLATGEETHTYTCNSSDGILKCEHSFWTRNCETRSATRQGGTSQNNVNGPTSVARP